MITLLKEFFYDRISSSRKAHPIYILPTIDGLKVMALNFILLVMGLIYANNYVLLFNFILFCLFLGSMFYTHFNLSGLTLKNTQFPSMYVNENGVLSLTFNSSNAQGHYFIRPYFKNSKIKILDPKSGRLYKCFIELEGSEKLKVRGYIGISLIGRSQIWHRLK